jgi:hypothetical protein
MEKWVIRIEIKERKIQRQKTLIPFVYVRAALFIFVCLVLRTNRWHFIAFKQ